MKRINLNHMARDITLKEGGKVSLSIAQVKEVMKIFLEELAKKSTVEVVSLVGRYRKE